MGRGDVLADLIDLPGGLSFRWQPAKLISQEKIYAFSVLDLHESGAKKKIF